MGGRNGVQRLPNQFSGRKFLATGGLAGLGGAPGARRVEPRWLEVGPSP